MSDQDEQTVFMSGGILAGGNLAGGSPADSCLVERMHSIANFDRKPANPKPVCASLDSRPDAHSIDFHY